LTQRSYVTGSIATTALTPTALCSASASMRTCCHRPSACLVDAILEVPGVESFPSVRSSESTGPPIRNSRIQASCHSWHCSDPARIDILLYLSEYQKSTEIPVLNFTVTQTAMFVK
jgi:hypothetical protein